MKKTVIWILSLCIILAIGAAIFYRYYAPQLMADVIIKEELPSYLPKSIQQKIQKYKEPLNAVADDVVIQMQEENIEIEKLTAAIDKINEDQIEAITSELKVKQPQTANDVFDIIKKQIQPDFDIEILREPFSNHVTEKMIRQNINRINSGNINPDIDLEMIKTIAKTLLIQKHAQLEVKNEEAK